MTVPRFVITLVAASCFLAPAAGQADSTPAGFRSTGTLVVQATISGSPLNVGGNIALYRRAAMYRLDVLSLGFPGASSTASAMAGALLAPGGATLLYNGATGALSAYSNANRAYYQDAAKPAGAGRNAAPVTTSSVTTDPLATLGGIVRQLHDVVHASVALTGHSVTNGHPTADMDVLLRRQRTGKAVEDYHAQIALADDLDGLPVRILFSSTPPTPQDLGGSLRLDLTSISAQTPDDSLFAVPSGYVRVASLGEVLQPTH